MGGGLTVLCTSRRGDGYGWRIRVGFVFCFKWVFLCVREGGLWRFFVGVFRVGVGKFIYGGRRGLGVGSFCCRGISRKGFLFYRSCNIIGYRFG